RTADAAVLVDANPHLAQVAITGLLRAGVDDTAGAALTEQNGVRPALDVDGLDVVAIPRNVREIQIAGVVGADQTANAVRGLRPQIGVRVRRNAATRARIVAVNAANFR